MQDKVIRLSARSSFLVISLLLFTLNVQGVFASEAPSFQFSPVPSPTTTPNGTLNTNLTISVPYNSLNNSGGTNLLVPTGATAVVVGLSGINSTGSNAAFHIVNAANPSSTPSPTPSTIKTSPTLAQFTINNLYTNPSSGQLVIYQPTGSSLTTTSPSTINSGGSGGSLVIVNGKLTLVSSTPLPVPTGIDKVTIIGGSSTLTHSNTINTTVTPGINTTVGTTNGIPMLSTPTPTPSPTAQPTATPSLPSPTQSPVPTETPTPTVNPTSTPQPTSTPTPNPTLVPSASPTSIPTPTPSPTVTPSNNTSGSVSAVPPVNSSPSPTITPSVGLTISSSSYDYSNNNSGYFNIGPSPKPSATPSIAPTTTQITTITSAPKQQNILVTGFTFVIQSLNGILSFFGIVK